MKKSLLLFITLISLSHITYASFPVTEEMNNSTDITQNNNQIESVPEIDWTAFNLCLFGGYLGLHRFYLGHNGIAYLQLMTFGGLGIWWLIDLIKIVRGDLYRGPLNPQFPSIDWTMLSLCLAGGLLGLHRFYRNKSSDWWGWPKKDKNIALFQLCTLGGFGIWWLIDLVKILTGKLYK